MTIFCYWWYYLFDRWYPITMSVPIDWYIVDDDDDDLIRGIWWLIDVLAFDDPTSDDVIRHYCWWLPTIKLMMILNDIQCRTGDWWWYSRYSWNYCLLYSPLTDGIGRDVLLMMTNDQLCVKVLFDIIIPVVFRRDDMVTPQWLGMTILPVCNDGGKLFPVSPDRRGCGDILRQ